MPNLDAVLAAAGGMVTASPGQQCGRFYPVTAYSMEVRIYAPEGLPSHAPHIPYCGPDDVQPSDPLDPWESPPMEPQIRNGKDGKALIFARAARGDKAQFMAARAAIPFLPESERNLH
jgi:hypothetical protein